MDNLLLSFPRSGNTWVRYFLEFITKRPTSMKEVSDCQEGVDKKDTIGVPGVDVRKKCIAIKRHRGDNHWDDFNKDNTKLILLVRDWREACLRHLTPEQKKIKSEVERCASGYIHCLKFFDDFKGEKILVHYEDLILSPRDSMDRIVDFLSIERNDDYVDFWNNFEKHRSFSVKSYPAGSFTKGVKDNLKMHSNIARGSKVISQIDYVVRRERRLCETYLSRYV